MKIVIDIPEDVFDEIYYNNYYSLKGKAALRVAVKNGTPLPKGHGRLIDVDEIIRTICGKSCGRESEECGYKVPCFSVTRINSAPIIIEADKEGVE